LDLHCQSLSEYKKTELALALTQCHYTAAGRTSGSLSLHNMDDTVFQIYTQFYLQTTSICSFLSASVFQEEMDRSIEALVINAHDSLAAFKKLHQDAENVSQLL
jgi:hypothetical protein